MDKDKIISDFILELRRGTLILCVLAKLQEPTYGYSLIAELANTGIAIEANTLYPLLRRLEGQGLLDSAWNTEGAKPRKYYQTTAFGQEVLSVLKTHWQATADNLNTILEGKDHD
ncbi:MAG: PadR family transcriptional regulator [Coriobacteriia bacterium]|nr:PadR family transcriptional regulator [Coriobacteriia bacterium]